MIAKFKWKRTLRQLSIVATLAILYSTPCQAAIIDILNTTSGVATNPGSLPTPDVLTVPFDAGAIADKLVVQVSSETGAGTTAITYNGVPLIQAASPNLRFGGIWYLDNPFTGGSAPLTIDMSSYGGAVNGISVGAVSLTGSAPGSTDADSGAGDSVTVNVADANSFVVAGHGSDGNGGVSPDSPLVPLYALNNIGSARGAAGFENGVVVGSQTYSFSGVGATPATGAAVFAPAATGDRLPITDLFTTGVDANGVPLANGTLGDPHYDLFNWPTLTPTSAERIGSGNGVPGSWLGDSAVSAWVGPNDDNNLRAPPGDYLAETTFTIPFGVPLDLVVINGNWATDNGKLDILLNGVSVAQPADLVDGSGAYTDFEIGAGAPFQYGLNTLGFAWRNAGSSNNAAGIRVGYLLGSYSTVPEPGTYALLGLLLLGALAYRCRAGHRRPMSLAPNNSRIVTIRKDDRRKTLNFNK